MNWLIYIGGFILGLALVVKLFSEWNDTAFAIINISWIMTWIWICLKFIK